MFSDKETVSATAEVNARLLKVPEGCKVLCFCHTNQFFSPKIASSTAFPDQKEQNLTFCGNPEHSTSTDVGTVSAILMQQVRNLKTTDEGWRQNLNIAMGNLDRVKFVRGVNYLTKMSTIVKEQETELQKQQKSLDCKF